MPITIAGLWRQGRDLAEQHAATTIPIAAAFMFLPQIVRMVIVGPGAEQPGEVTGGDILGSLLVLVLTFVGQAAIASIMLGGPGGPYNVADALRRATGLLPRMLLVMLIIALSAMPLLLVAALIIILLVGPGQANDPQTMVRAAGLLIIPVIALVAYFGARFFLLFPVLVAETPPAWDAIRRTWFMTRPHRWTLIGFMLSALLAIMFLTAVVNIVAGAVLGLLLGKSALAQLLTLTFVTLVGTAVGLIITGASVAAYRSVERQPAY
jgi:hypothetical protein